MSYQVTIEIACAKGEISCSAFVNELVAEYSGPLRLWSPEGESHPARATLVFDSEEARDRFVAAAMHMPRVKLGE